jgi:phosphate-selective porin
VQNVEREEPDIKVKWSPGPTFSSKDGSWSVHVFGRLQVDGGALGDDDDFYKNDNATELRAARLGVEGNFLQGWKYKLETDFGLGEVDVKDAYIEYDGEFVEPAYVRIGQYKVPNSLEWLTNRLFITFMERAAIVDSFGLTRQIGLGSGVSGKNWALTPACSARTQATRTATRAMRSPAVVTTLSCTVQRTAGARSTWAPRRAIATSTTTPLTARSGTNSGHSFTLPARAAWIPGR